MTDREKLFDIILKRSFKYSKEPVFKLQSGQLSHYYIDLKKTTLHPEGIYLIGEEVYDLIKDKDIKGIGGLTLGADPIALSVSLSALKNGREIYPFIVRKEAKGHGTGKKIEASFDFPAKVIVLEDVMTTGSSAIKAIQASQEQGLEVLEVICIINREEGGKENIEKDYQIPVTSLFTKTQLFQSQNEKENT